MSTTAGCITRHAAEKLIVAFIAMKSPIHKEDPATGHYLEAFETTAHRYNASLRSVLILFSYLCLYVCSGLFYSGFLTKITKAFLISHICAACPAHLILLY
jgi:hypothetical protein